MRRRQFLTTAAALALSGCGFGESRLNPLNWFRSDPDTTTASPIVIERPSDRRPLVAEVTSLVVEPTPGGAIIRATGLPPEQGWWDAALVNADRDGQPVDGILTYSFRARPPRTRTRVSTARSRELTAAVAVSNVTLSATRQIRVTGALNSRTARR